MLDGACLRKTRYYHPYNDHVYSIDVYEGELEGLILCKTEADCLEKLLRISPPEYITQEVTEDSFFTAESPGYFQRLRSEFYAQRLASRWLFSTPGWMREDALALRLLKRMRVLALVRNVGVLIYIYVIISYRQL